MILIVGCPREWSAYRKTLGIRSVFVCGERFEWCQGYDFLGAQPGIGAAIWLHATDIHDALVADGRTIVSGNDA